MAANGSDENDSYSSGRTAKPAWPKLAQWWALTLQ